MTKIPNSRRNLDLAIDRITHNREEALQTKRIMANIIVGQMLPNSVVKGGSALKIRYGNQTTRFSMDLDTARAIDLDNFIKQLDRSLKEGWNNFAGSVVKRQPATPKDVPESYVMKPFDVKLQYNSRPWITVPLEVGHNEIGDADKPEYIISKDAVNIFEKLGFPAPKPIPVIPITHQIAQKLHAVTEPSSKRAHDLIDLQIIINNDKIDYAKTNDICRRLFKYRNMQPWPSKVIKGEDWDMLYDNQSAGLNVLPNINDAINWVNNLIDKIKYIN